jgi:hypothetical protein
MSCSKEDNEANNSNGGNHTPEQQIDSLVKEVEKAFAIATVVDLEYPGTLSEIFPASKKYTTKSLKIRGAINGTDIVYLHDMMHKASGGELYALDLSECVITKGGACYFEEYGLKHYTEENIMTPDMFHECDVLKYFKTPAKILSIRGAFKNCWNLEYIDIGNTVKRIEPVFISYNYYQEDGDYESFENRRKECDSKITINISDVASWCSMDYVNREICHYRRLLNNKTIKDLNIPDGVVSICDKSFFNIESLESVSIPSSVKTIGNEAFELCPKLTTVTIPSSVKTIGNEAFELCPKLTTVTIPEGVTNIGYSAFSGCSSLVSVTIPNSITNIGSRAFYGCSSLTSVKSYIRNPEKVSPDAFPSNQATLYVPKGTIEKYKSSKWSNYFDNIVEGDYE